MNTLIESNLWLAQKIIRYAQHPAFSVYHPPQIDSDSWIIETCQTINHEIEALEVLLSCNRLSLEAAIHQLLPKFAQLFAHLDNLYKSQVPDAQKFLTSVWKQTLRVLIDDLAYFERRNSLNPMLKDQHELNMYWSLEQQGFFTCQVPQEVLDEVRRVLQPWMNIIQDRAAQGLNSREELSINQIPSEIVQYLSQHFETLGISPAIRGVRRESCVLSGFALELSVPNADWWQSSYQDLGYQTGRCSYFHLDEGRDVYKAILYLSDVLQAENGATGCIPQTFAMKRDRLPWVFSRSLHLVDRSLYNDIGATGRLTSSPTFRRHFMMMPEYLRENSHWGFDLIDTLPNSLEVANSEVKVLGNAGTCFVFDGSRLVHRGGLVQSGHRWALQIIFGVDRQNAVTAVSKLPPSFQKIEQELSTTKIVF